MADQFHFVDQSGTSREPKPHFGSVAFWVKEDTVMEVDTRHIHVIIDRPELFGLTKEIVDTIHDETGEKHGTEGVARARLIQRATQNSWIRVRHYVNRNKDYWSIQLDDRDSRITTVRRFITWAIQSGYMHQDVRIRISD